MATGDGPAAGASGRIYDSSTGLQWGQKTTTVGSGVNGADLHDVDSYSHGAITTIWDWLSQVNAANYAGHSDWRLPSESGCRSCWSSGSCTSCSAHELETSLLSSCPCGTSPCVASIFGTTGSYFDWSSSDAFEPVVSELAWTVIFVDGFANADAKVRNLFVRAVRRGT